MTRTPQQGGIMRGGPFDGRIMAYYSAVMPAYSEDGKRVGTYIWDDLSGHWEFEEDDNKPDELYP